MNIKSAPPVQGSSRVQSDSETSDAKTSKGDMSVSDQSKPTTGFRSPRKTPKRMKRSVRSTPDGCTRKEMTLVNKLEKKKASEPGKRVGNDVFGDLWDSLMSVMVVIEENNFEALSNEYSKEKLYGIWSKNQKENQLPYTLLDWDLCTNLVSMGLSNPQYWQYSHEIIEGTAWECLDSYLNAKTKRSNVNGNIRGYLLKIFPKAECLNMGHINNLPVNDVRGTDEEGAKLFGSEKEWCEIKKYLVLDDDAFDNRWECINNDSLGIPEELQRVVRDFLAMIPQLPDETDDDAERHPYDGHVIRRTDTTTEFNVSEDANRMNSENIHAMLSFPLRNQIYYGYDTITLQRLYFILNAILYINKYHFIVLDDKHPELERDLLFHRRQFCNKSIIPFLVSFIPSQSSIPTDGNLRGDNVNLENLREYYRLLEEKLSDDEYTEPATKISKIQTASDSRSPDRSSLVERSPANRSLNEFSSVAHRQVESVDFANESAGLHTGPDSAESKSEVDVEIMEESIDREEANELKRELTASKAESEELKRELVENRVEKKKLQYELRIRKISEGIKDGIINYQAKGVYSEGEGKPERFIGKPNYCENLMSNKQGVCFYNAAMEILYSMISCDDFAKFIKGFKRAVDMMATDDMLFAAEEVHLWDFRTEGHQYCLGLLDFMETINDLRMKDARSKSEKEYKGIVKNKTIALLNSCREIKPLKRFFKVPRTSEDGSGPSIIKDLIIDHQSLPEFIEALLNHLNRILIDFSLSEEYVIPLHFDSYDVKSGLGENFWLRSAALGNRKGLVFNVEVDFNARKKYFSLQSILFNNIVSEIDVANMKRQPWNTTNMFKRSFATESWDKCNDESYDDILTFTTHYPVLQEDQKLLLLNLHYVGDISFSASGNARDFIINTDQNFLKVVFYCVKRDGFFMRRYRFDTMVLYSDPLGNRCGHYFTAKYSTIGSVGSWMVLDDLSADPKSDMVYSWREFALEREAVPEVILCVSDCCDEKVDGLEEEMYQQKF
ncbi:hypothetical protein [Kistimonas asteriae]|uniref:hypothetical protein n=1 Tax=Kistimonas asteriae TaxID=517724 RepID=UPI001BACE1BE|nr:hypothetical protein [Kistimonas asteriae]